MISYSYDIYIYIYIHTYIYVHTNMKFTLKYTQNKLKHEHMISYGGFHKWGIPKTDGL